MRAITKQAVNAFLLQREFKSGNTSVEIFHNASYLILFGNIIAVKYSSGKISISNAGWFSNTTKERLNGITGVSISQKKGIWYLNGKEWNGALIEVTA